MPKVVINANYGGFFLSDEALARIRELKGYTSESEFRKEELRRDDRDLVTAVEEMQEKAGGNWSELKIVEVPDDVEWEIQEYDGWEWVAEKHRTWH